MVRYIQSQRETELFVTGLLETLLPEDSVARSIAQVAQGLHFGAYDALHGNDAVGRSAVYQAPTPACQSCPAKSQCCPQSKEGRSVNRSLYKETLDRVSQRVKFDEGRRRKIRRSIVCVGAFARLIEKLHWRRCRMWGRAGAEMELAWRPLAHNVMLLAGIWQPITGTAQATG